jgi:Uma2 family endonuclease
MSQPNVELLRTVDEYPRVERSSEERHEFLDGRIHAMANASRAHADISANIVGILYAQLKGTPCRPRTKDTKVRSGPRVVSTNRSAGMFSCPDVVGICGEPEYFDDTQDVILNPTLIVEVLSPSTEAFDRGEKFNRYRV